MPSADKRIGLVLGLALAPVQLREMAKLSERLGYSEVWLAEDYFFTGGISTATSVLASTAKIEVGIGVLAAVARHPALLAMELATVSALYPGRLRPAVGLGVPAWLQQMGLLPGSSIAALRECVTAVRSLLSGGEVTVRGGTFTFDQVRLSYPPPEQLPLQMGVIGPRHLRLSGEIADGTILSALASPQYVSWARERIAEGAAIAGRGGPHSVTVYALFAVDSDGKKAKSLIKEPAAFYLAPLRQSSLCKVYGISDELEEMAKGGPEQILREMPAQWVDDLTVAGDPDECAAAIQRLFDAGADSVALFLAHAEHAQQFAETAAKEVLPRFL